MIIYPHQKITSIADIVEPMKIEGVSGVIPMIKTKNLARFLAVSIGEVAKLFPHGERGALYEHEVRTALYSLMDNDDGQRVEALEELKNTCRDWYAYNNEPLKRDLDAIDIKHIELTDELLEVKNIALFLSLHTGELDTFELYQIYLLGKMRGKREERERRKKRALAN